MTRRLRRGLLVLALLAASCTSSSASTDLTRVRELVDLPLPPAVRRPPEPEVPAEVREILARPLEVDDAVRVALLNNRELRANLREIGIARGRRVQAGLLPNPIFEAEVFPERNTEVALRFEYDVSSAILRGGRARAADAEVQAAHHLAAARVVEIAGAVRMAFFALQAAENRWEIAQRALDVFAAGRDAAEALLEAGNVPELDLATQSAAFERARITVARLALERADRREALQRLLGLHGELTSWRIAGQLPPASEQVPPWEGLETQAIEASLDLRELRDRAESSARWAAAFRQQGWLPALALDIHSLVGDPEEPGRGWRFGAGVTIGLPIFNREQGNVLAREAEFEALLERHHALAIEIRSAVREAWNRLVSAHGRARQYQQVILPAQRRVSEQTLLQYNAMQVSVFPLLQARRAELDAELEYVDTLREYWTASAALEALLAGRRMGSAVRPAAFEREAGAMTAGDL